MSHTQHFVAYATRRCRMCNMSHMQHKNVAKATRRCVCSLHVLHMLQNVWNTSNMYRVSNIPCHLSQNHLVTEIINTESIKNGILGPYVDYSSVILTVLLPEQENLYRAQKHFSFFSVVRDFKHLNEYAVISSV